MSFLNPLLSYFQRFHCPDIQARDLGNQFLFLSQDLGTPPALFELLLTMPSSPLMSKSS